MNKENIRHIMFIQNRLNERDKLEQLAEECSELGKASLKLIRAKGISGNPTPTSVAKAEADLKEEALDVLACLLVCGYDLNALCSEVVHDNVKWARWAERIKKLKRGAKELM